MHGSQSAQNPSILPSNLLALLTRGHKICVISAQIEFLGGTRYRSNVWDYRGQNTFHKGRLEELAMHPTVKPVALIADAMRDCSKLGDIVLDCFGGSGTTIIAAEKTDRRAYVMEIEPRYVDTSIRRWQAFTGKDAVLEKSGHTFAQEEEARND